MFGILFLAMSLFTVVTNLIIMLVSVIFMVLSIVLIILGFLLKKNSDERKYFGYYTIVTGILMFLLLMIPSGVEHKEEWNWIVTGVNFGGIEAALMIFGVYFIITILASLYYIPKRMILKNIEKEESKEEEETKIVLPEEVIEKNRKFSILFVYSEKDEFLRLKKVRLQEIAEKNMGMEFTEVNIDNKSDEEIKQNYLYSRYPFVAVLKEDEIIYKKEGMFKLIEIEKILKQYI